MMKKADLILHPVRFRILRLLDRQEMTTNEIGQVLDDVPNSSIYRHLKLLLDGGMIEISDTQLIKGIEEKTYRLLQPAALESEDISSWTAEDHLHYFTSYVLTLLHDFERYARRAEERDGSVMLAADPAGYREVSFWATKEELQTAIGGMNQAIGRLLQNQPERGRGQYKLATILHPLDK